MRRRQKEVIVCFLCFALGAITAGICQIFSEEHVFVSTSDWQRQLIAKIVWRKSSPTLIDCYLVVENFYGKRMLKMPLVFGKDEPIDIFLEFKSLSISDGVVIIDSRHDFYKGPSRVEIGRFSVDLR